jgi:hypothetical protein
MIVAVMLGGGLAAAVSTPALAVNNFIVNWASLRGHGSDPLACVYGHNYAYGNDFIYSYNEAYSGRSVEVQADYR